VKVRGDSDVEVCEVVAGKEEKRRPRVAQEEPAQREGLLLCYNNATRLLSCDRDETGVSAIEALDAHSK